MPYIKKERRVNFHSGLEALEVQEINNAGELNYIVSMLCKKYANSKKFSYQVINDIIGALECAKNEYIRRNVNNYEDLKITENGDLE